MTLDVHLVALGRAWFSVLDRGRVSWERVRLAVAFFGIAAFVAAALVIAAFVAGTSAYLSLALAALALYAEALFLPMSKSEPTPIRPELRLLRIGSGRHWEPRHPLPGTRRPAGTSLDNVVPMAGRERGRMASEKQKEGDCRCSCGRLLARATERGIEVKCARCGRVMSITWSEVADKGRALPRGNPERSSKSNPQ